MFEGRRVTVVVPAYNEEKLVGRVLDTLPAFVDRAIVVDDGSLDGTADVLEAAQGRMGGRLRVLRHGRNAGVGAAIISGYRAALEECPRNGLVAVMAGDAQMDPDDLPRLLAPLAHDQADYTKGNRLFTGEAWKIIPRHRYLGNAVLSFLTKVASGYWHVADSQSGYTAITTEALAILQLGRLYPRYGFPNHLLVELNNYDFRVRDVPIRPVYGVGEVSGIRLPRVIPTISWLLVKCYFWRMKEKYIIRDSHPLIFFLTLGLLVTGTGLLLGLLHPLPPDLPRRALAEHGDLRRVPAHQRHADALLRHVDGHGAQQGAQVMFGSPPVAVGLAGCGYWGKNLARNLFQMGHLGAVCDASPKVLKDVKASYKGVRTTADFSSLLDDKKLKAIALATPAAQHHEMAKAALLAGKDVFVEKPLALRVPEAEELVALARKRKRVLMVGHILEYHPAIRKLKEFADSGELGDIHYVYSNRLNLGKVRPEENILWSFAPHDISVILLLLDALPEWASTSGQNYLQHEIADVTMTCLAFPGKARAHIFVSWLHPFKEQKLVVVGSRKMAVFDDVVKEGKLKIYDKGIDWKNGQPVIRQTAESTLFFPEMEPLREELSHFVECVRSRKTPRTDGVNGLRVLKVLDACQRSIETGGVPVRLGS